MGLVRKSTKPAAITDASGQPHLEVEVAGLKITTTPPKKRAAGDERAGDADGAR